MKLHVKYTETYPDTLPEFSIDMEEGDLEQEDFDTIMAKVTESVKRDVYQHPHRKGRSMLCLKTHLTTEHHFQTSNWYLRLRRQ